MKKHSSKKISFQKHGILLMLIMAMNVISGCKQNQPQPTDFVNLFIGTLDVGNTVPAATAPFGMISCGPDNVFDEVLDEYTSRAGYNYKKDSIRQFSMTHVSGWGCHGALDIPLMPTTKTPGDSPVYNHRAYASRFSHDNETAVPGYYQVFLDDAQTNVQITAAERSAILLFDYPDGEYAHLIFAPTNAANGITGAKIMIDSQNNQVTGWATSGGFCWRDPSNYDYTVYFVAQFDQPISGSGIWNAEEMYFGKTHVTGDSIGAWISFGNKGKRTVEMRIAISFVSIENAKENLQHELKKKTFAQVRSETSRKWNKLLSKVELNTNDHDLKVQGYSALYNNLLHPNIFNDVNGQYRGFNDSVYIMPKGHNKYVNFSTWDTYRTTAYLQGLLVPDRAADMIESLYLDAQQGNPAGLTIWGYFNNETWVMNGHSSIPLIANMYAMGARDIDLTRIRNEMIRTADNKYRNGDQYIRFGYVPDRPAPHNYSVSQTLEYSIGDFGLAQMCLADGDMENYERFMTRSRSVFNLFNDEIGYLQRRDSLGNWVFPFDRAEENGFNEGNSAQYTWNIPHMMDELVKRMGGPEKAIELLNEFTSVIHTDGWPVDEPHYWPGNQPGFVVPFVYTYAGAHKKTQELVRYVSSNIFKNTPDGMPGDDDLGATSCMNLFFTLGMYPLKPGVPEFCLTGVLYDSVKIRLDNGSQILITSKGDQWNSPIKSIKVNGETLNEPFLNIAHIIEKPGKIRIEYEY
jgi:predicted alpha-1,2-mannosidase